VIELDNNATTRPTSGVVAAMATALAELWHNPSSVHRAGQDARRGMELARASVAKLIGAKPREIVFTSGGTEALDLSIRGVLESRGMFAGAKPVLVTSRVEHASIRELAEELQRRGAAGGAEVRWVDIGLDGCLDLASMRGCVARDALVVVQWANNETGAIQPIGEIGAMCREVGATLLVDGTQWVGKMPTDIGAGLCDALVFAPHKWTGPKGVGVLWARSGVRMRPQLLGTQELGRRGGTENVPAIIGAGVASEEAIEWLARAAERTRLAGLRDDFERMVCASVPDAVVNGPQGRDARLWNTTNIGFPRLEAEALLLLLSEQGVAASAGAACSSGSLDPSPVLMAMGVPEAVAHGSLRFSLSRETTRAEMEEAGRKVVACVGKLRKSWHEEGA